MICPKCRDGDHAHCYDTQHPQQNYRGMRLRTQAPRRTAGAVI